MADKTPRIDWGALLQAVQKIKYRSAVGMLTIAVLAMAAVFAIVALRASDSGVQLALIVATGTTALAFFAAIVLVIKILGPYALLSSSQVTTYRKMEMGAKGIAEPPDVPPILDPRYTQQLPSAATTEENPT